MRRWLCLFGVCVFSAASACSSAKDGASGNDGAANAATKDDPKSSSAPAPAPAAPSGDATPPSDPATPIAPSASPALISSAQLAGMTIADFPGSKIFVPRSTPAPGIVMLHGSEGGSDGTIEAFAQELARNGFVVVTMCWFGCDGKPSTILRIPLESVVDIGNWLKTRPQVSGKVGLFGWSRGAELALLVSSLTNTAPYEAVAVHAPSDTVVGAFDPSTEEQPPNFGSILEPVPNTNEMRPAPSWTWAGTPLYGEPTPDFNTPGPLIQVTNFTGPMYVSQGMQDEVWPVSRGQHVVAERQAVPSLVTQSHFWPGEGHVLMRFADIKTQTQEVSDLFAQSLQ